MILILQPNLYNFESMFSTNSEQLSAYVCRTCFYNQNQWTPCVRLNVVYWNYGVLIFIHLSYLWPIKNFSRQFLLFHEIYLKYKHKNEPSFFKVLTYWSIRPSFIWNAGKTSLPLSTKWWQLFFPSTISVLKDQTVASTVAHWSAPIRL